MSKNTSLAMNTVDFWVDLFAKRKAAHERAELRLAWRDNPILADDNRFDAFVTWCYAWDKHSYEVLLNFNDLAPALFSTCRTTHWSKLSALLPDMFKNGLFVTKDGGPQPAMRHLCALFKARGPQDDDEVKARFSFLANIMAQFSAMHWDRLGEFSTHNPRLDAAAFLNDVAPENRGLWDSLSSLDLSFEQVVETLHQMAVVPSMPALGVELPTTFHS